MPGPGEAGLTVLPGGPPINPAALEIELAAASSIPLHILRRARAHPFALEGDRLQILIADPGDLHAVDELRLASEHPIDVLAGEPDAIDRALDDLQEASAHDSFAPHPDPSRPSLRLQPGEPGGVELLDALFARAATARASDLHLIPEAGGLAARIRVDGVMHDLITLSLAQGAAVLGRLKVVGGLDIGENRRPQDGRVTVGLGNGEPDRDARIATLPTVGGEGAVIRFFEAVRVAPTLTALGLSNPMQMALERVLRLRSGALIVVGPTGAGKSTTAHACLSDLRTPDIAISTVEDPVEQKLEGAFQLQVSKRTGVTFPLALRAVLRADPDVVLVGEIRDQETAQIAIEAAQTGHIVLSTMHSPDAPGAIGRLANMGVEPYMIASAVNAVLAQRLARKLCEQCREAYTPPPEQLLALGVGNRDEVRLYRAAGCPRCSDGYRGRVGIFQLLTVTREVSEAISSGATAEMLETVAAETGMRTLFDDGLEKALLGLTSLDEVRRVIA